jgi:hypothetical protein
MTGISLLILIETPGRVQAERTQGAVGLAGRQVVDLSGRRLYVD